MRKLFYPLLILLLLITSCQDRKERLARIWLFDRIDFVDNEKTSADFNADIVHPMDISGESFLNLQADGRYTSYFGYFDAGRWDLKGSSLELNSGIGMSQAFTLKYVGKELVLYYQPRLAKYTFRPGTQIGLTDKNNPFLQSSNNWRTKPGREETEAQIRARLLNYLSFWENYFSWGAQNNISRLEVNNIDSPLRFYANGFELIPFDEEPYNWKNHFYNDSNAREAYTQLSEVISRSHIKWPDTDNRFLMFSSVFRQMQDGLKQGQ